MGRDGDFEVEAAGGLVWRPAGDNVEVLLVHRPRYDDWSLPKGKLDPGETHEQAALREVEEEAGVRCELGDELEPHVYTDNRDRLKRVRWWAMRASGGDGFQPNDEVDELRWLDPADALELLTYTRDRELVGRWARATSS